MNAGETTSEESSAPCSTGPTEQKRLNAFVHLDVERDPRPGPRRRSTQESRRAVRPAGGRAGRDQGRALRRGRADDLRQPDAPELPPAVRRHGDRPAPGRRRDPVRQDEHGRVRDGLVDREQRLRTDAQSLGRGADPRRLVGRLGRGCRGRTGPARPSAPTPAARSASPPPSAASSASNRPTAGSAATA